MKKLVVFDLDGTLAESKTSLDEEMSTLITDLLHVVKVAIISGGDWPQFEKQVLYKIPNTKRLKNLYLLPACGTKFYEYKSGWKKRYSEDFAGTEREKILQSLTALAGPSEISIKKAWGEQIEDRGSQITFSALGQNAPLTEKKKWDPDFAKRKKMQDLLKALIPEFSINLGGTTSIDITKQGINKAYGIRKLRDLLDIRIKEMIFVGDAIFEGGNDYPAKETGVACIPVKDIDQTKRVIETMIACLNPGHKPKKKADE